MSFVTFQQCAAAVGWHEVEVDSSSGKGSYVVTVPPWGIDDAVCDCRGYQFRQKCRHLDAARKQCCDWNSVKRDAQTPVQRMQNICPECGSETITLTVEVPDGESEDK